MGIYYSRTLCADLITATAVSLAVDCYVGRTGIRMHSSPQGEPLVSFQFNPNVFGFTAGIGALWQSLEAIVRASRAKVPAPILPCAYVIAAGSLAAMQLTAIAIAARNGTLRLS
jgi:hypothetical protein